MIDIFSIAIAVGIALTIGAISPAPAVGPLYGSGSRGKIASLLIAGIFMALGAIFASSSVTKTLSSGYFTDHAQLGTALALIGPAIILVILATAAFTGIPVSTSQGAVAIIIGIALLHNSLNYKTVGQTLVAWLALPLLSFGLSFLSAKTLLPAIKRRINVLRPEVREKTTIFLTIAGAFVAFSAGANNTANAVSGIVAVGAVNELLARFIAAGAFIAGSLLFGGRVLETVGFRITTICQIRATIIAFEAGTLVLAASLLGLPVSLSQTVSAAVMGFAFAREGGCFIYKNPTIRNVLVYWVAAPVAGAASVYFVLLFAGV